MAVRECPQVAQALAVCVCLVLGAALVNALPANERDANRLGQTLALRSPRDNVIVDPNTSPTVVGSAQKTEAPRQEDAPVLEGADSDVLGRKKTKKKTNSTVGEEVLTAVIDGITGEAEEATFGSDIREEIDVLIDAITKFGSKRKPSSSDSRDIKTEQAGVAPSPSLVKIAGVAGRAIRALATSEEEGRGRHVRRLVVRYLVLLKVLALGIILPGAVLFALLQSWKAVTVSLLALLLAGVVGLRGLVSTAATGLATKSIPEVIHTGPGNHYWRRVAQEQQQESDPGRLAYSAYTQY